jgi:hypothetical protein
VNIYLLGCVILMSVTTGVMLPRINEMKKLEAKYEEAKKANESGSVIGFLLAIGVAIDVALMSTDKPAEGSWIFWAAAVSLSLVGLAALWLWFQSKIKLDCEEVVYET